MCHAAGCGKKGDIVTLLARILHTTRAVVLADLSTRYAMDVSKIVDPITVERFHAAIWAAGPLLRELASRGVTKDIIRKYRIGEREGRITIPVKNETGLFVNVRRYLPGAPGNEKMRNTPGHGKIRLYPIEQLEYDELVLCGGEIKAIVAANELNSHGIGAISTTSGEGNWDPSFTQKFQGKKVWVCMDVDDGGREAAKTHCTILSRVTRWIGNLVLPLDVDKYPHGDINDYVGVEKKQLLPLLRDTKEWAADKTTVLVKEDPTVVELTAAVDARIAEKRIKFSAVVSAMDTAPYVIPREVNVECDRSQKECAACNVYVGKDDDTYVVPDESAAILEMIATHRIQQRESLMRALGIPTTCKICDFSVKTYYNAEDTRLSPQLEITNRNSDRIMQPAVCVGHGLELNESYEFVGRMYPHPKTQQSTLLLSSHETTEDALSTYECKNLERLEIFQPRTWTVDEIASKLDHIYTDLEANVTRIFQRRDLHLAIDLAYHSPLLMKFDDRVVKGWSEVLVLGDSSQGKSETALNYIRHYGLGEKVECKNATVAGLLGGLQQMGNRWFVTWGVIPTHDKRLVVLEELKGASQEVIARLTDMRSSGIAEIPKIEKRRTHARTRLVALSNPRRDRPLSAYNFGVEAVKELIGGLEDIRRFDLTLLVSSSDIDPATLNVLQRQRPKVEHTYTGELCRSLILWAWTRTANHVTFELDAIEFILESATGMSEKFSDTIPLIDRGSARYKLARLSAALAARTFSKGQDDSLCVKKCHVEYVVSYVDRLYSNTTFGYAAYTSAINTTSRLQNADSIKKHLTEMPFPRDFVEQLLHSNKIDLQDIQDWCAWDRMEASRTLSFLVRRHALVRDGRSYRKTSTFIEFLRSLLHSDEFMDRPDFIPEEF
jgi:hypothetical protein